MNYLILALLLTQTPNGDRQFQELQNQLQKFGFHITFSPPPQRGAYGLLEPKTKKIWINPVVFDLGIANPTLIHETVHAAQVCAGKGKIKALGLAIEPINYARPFFLGYQDIQRRDLEREAYAVQTQPNSYELALSLLKKNCQTL
jgi:hypothetical protein